MLSGRHPIPDSRVQLLQRRELRIVNVEERDRLYLINFEPNFFIKFVILKNSNIIRF